MLLKKYIAGFACVLTLSACGATGIDFPSDIPTDSSPIVSRVDPASGVAGDIITVYGLGFSDEAPNNIVIIGNVATSATSYQLVNPPTSSEIESLTVTVPAGVNVGGNPVVVAVYANASNADISFTVTE